MEFYRVRALLFVGIPQVMSFEANKILWKESHENAGGITLFNFIINYHKNNIAKGRKEEVRRRLQSQRRPFIRGAGSYER